MKQVIQPDHIPLNKFELIVPGLPSFVFTSLSGLEEELDKVDLPDRSVATGGRTKPVEFECMHPMHHDVEDLALEAWFQEGQDPISPSYKKAATLTVTSLSGALSRAFTFPDLFIWKRQIPDFEMDNDGELAQKTWSFAASDVLPV